MFGQVFDSHLLPPGDKIVNVSPPLDADGFTRLSALVQNLEEILPKLCGFNSQLDIPMYIFSNKTYTAKQLSSSLGAK